MGKPKMTLSALDPSSIRNAYMDYVEENIKGALGKLRDLQKVVRQYEECCTKNVLAVEAEKLGIEVPNDAVRIQAEREAFLEIRQKVDALGARLPDIDADEEAFSQLLPYPRLHEASLLKPIALIGFESPPAILRHAFISFDVVEALGEAEREQRLKGYDIALYDPASHETLWRKHPSDPEIMLWYIEEKHQTVAGALCEIERQLAKT